MAQGPDIPTIPYFCLLRILEHTHENAKIVATDLLAPRGFSLDHRALWDEWQSGMVGKEGLPSGMIIEEIL